MLDSDYGSILIEVNMYTVSLSYSSSVNVSIFTKGQVTQWLRPLVGVGEPPSSRRGGGGWAVSDWPFSKKEEINEKECKNVYIDVQQAKNYYLNKCENVWSTLYWSSQNKEIQYLNAHATPWFRLAEQSMLAEQQISALSKVNKQTSHQGPQATFA